MALLVAPVYILLLGTKTVIVDKQDYSAWLQKTVDLQGFYPPKSHRQYI